MSTSTRSTSHHNASERSAPWDRDNPKTAKSQKHETLSPSAKASAKRHAKEAGRPYPNLVDNMKAARQQKDKKS